MARARIGEMLVQDGRIDALQLQSALAHQRRWGGRIGRAIVHLGFMEEPALLEAVGRQLGVPFVEIGDRVIPREVLRLVPERIVRERRALPLSRTSEGRGPLLVALAEPGDLGVLDEIAFATGMQIRAALASEADLERAIRRNLDGIATPPPEQRFADRPDAIDLPDDTSPLGPASGDPRRGGPRS